VHVKLCNRCSPGPPESSTQTASRSLQPLSQGSGDRPTDRPTDHTTWSVTIGGAHNEEAKFCYCLWLQQVFIGAVDSNTPAFVITAELWPPEVATFAFIWKNDPLYNGKIFKIFFFVSFLATVFWRWNKVIYIYIYKILFRKFTSRHRLTLSCWNVKFVRRKIGAIVRYLPDKKFVSITNCRYCADRAQNLQGPASNICFTFFQISLKSVHFRRSYSRPREGRSFGPEYKGLRTNRDKSSASELRRIKRT